MLELDKVEVRYGSITALHGISLRVEPGSIVTLIGANGAGKSTTLRAISGLARPSAGTIRYNGEDITHLPPHQIVGRGISHVPEGRMVFANLTVLENLKMGAYRLATACAGTRISTTSSAFSHGSRNARNSPPARSPAANSRCSPSAAR